MYADMLMVVVVVVVVVYVWSYRVAEYSCLTYGKAECAGVLLFESALLSVVYFIECLNVCMYVCGMSVCM